MRLRRKRKVEIVRFDRRDLEDVMDLFERRYAEKVGTPLSSAEFYRRYRAGEFDTPWAMAWSSYYEALLRTPEHEPLTKDAAERRADPRAVEIVEKMLPRVAV